MNDNKKKGELIVLPNSELSPAVLLHKILEKVDDIDGLVIIAKTKDGGIEVEHSTVTTAELAIMNLTMDEYTRDMCFPSIVMMPDGADED